MDILEELGLTTQEQDELKAHEVVQLNIQQVVDTEILSFSIDDETEEITGINNLSDKRFTTFMDENTKILASPQLPYVLYYSPSEHVWERWFTNDLGASIFNRLIDPLLDSFGQPFLYQSNKSRDLFRQACNRYAKVVSDRSAKELLGSPNPNIIMFQNGVYDFKTNEIRQGTPEDYQTFKMDYPLIQTDERTIVEDWLEYLVDDNIKLLMQYIGYLFYREYKFNVYTFFTNGKSAANGGNGKSHVLNYIHKLVSNNYSAVGLKQLDGKDKFATSSFYQKLVNIEPDTPDMYLDDSALLKALSGNDSILAQYKGKDSFEFRNYAKMIFSTNYLPRFRDDSEANLSRLVIIPFNRSLLNPEHKDQLAIFNKQVEERNSHETLGKFAWRCIQEFRDLLINNNMDRNPFDKSEQQLQMLADYKEDNNTVLQFLKDTDRKIVDNLDKTIPVSSLWEDYQAWCKDSQLKPYSRPNFNKKLEHMGATRGAKRANGLVIKSWLGIEEPEELTTDNIF